MRFVLPFLILILWAAPASPGTVYDNDNNAWVTDDATAAVPGAGSGLGAIVAPASDSIPAFDNHKFDLQVGLNAFGVAGDDSAGSEGFLTGATLYYRPSLRSRIGPRIQWNTVDRTWFSMSVPMGFKLFPDPWSSYIWWLNLDVLPHFVVRTDLDNRPRDSAWTWAPGVGIAAEIPMGGISFEAALGVAYPLSIEGITDQALNAAVEQLAAGVDVAVNFRFR